MTRGTFPNSQLHACFSFVLRPTPLKAADTQRSRWDSWWWVESLPWPRACHSFGILQGSWSIQVFPASLFLKHLDALTLLSQAREHAVSIIIIMIIVIKCLWRFQWFARARVQALWEELPALTAVTSSGRRKAVRAGSIIFKSWSDSNSWLLFVLLSSDSGIVTCIPSFPVDYRWYHHVTQSQHREYQCARSCILRRDFLFWLELPPELPGQLPTEFPSWFPLCRCETWTRADFQPRVQASRPAVRGSGCWCGAAPLGFSGWEELELVKSFGCSGVTACPLTPHRPSRSWWGSLTSGWGPDEPARVPETWAAWERRTGWVPW